MIFTVIPPDFSFGHLFAYILLLLCWISYSLIFKLMGKRTLNARLTNVRMNWIHAISKREGKPFDAILLGHIVHSVAFFGSATLIVLAGVLSILAGLESLHSTAIRLHFVENISLELFAVNYLLLASILTLSFFSFTYALRKLIYAIALIGALPEGDNPGENFNQLAENASTVLNESLITFNFGIRGYYYAIASIFMFVSPLVCIVVTTVVTAVLIYRQIGSNTSRAIIDSIKLTKDPRD